MSQYILSIIWLAIVYVISKNVNVYQKEYVLGRPVVRYNIGFVIFAILPFIWWAATRSRWYFDTNAYATAYEAMPSTFGGISSYMQGVTKDKGFSILSIFIKILVGNRVEVYFFVIAAFQLVTIALVYRKYSSNFLVSLFLFIASTDYISWMHNGIRQFTAVVLIFAATELLATKRYIPLILVILLASTMHGSALLMIPIVFIVQGRPWNTKIFFAILIFAIAILYVDNFTTLLNNLLSDTQYTNVVSDWKSWGDDGTNPIRVLVYSVPTLLSVLGIRHIRKEHNVMVNIACNMAIFSTLLYCLSVATSGIFIGRLPIYCSLYSMGILLPWEINHMFAEKSAIFIKIGMIMSFLGFYYYQVHMGWGLI